MPVVELSTIPGTEAAIGRARGHTLVVDRPEGKAGGQGLGFNGGELLALALGGCLANDLRYVAHLRGVGLGNVAIRVNLDIDGTPLLARSAEIVVACALADGGDPAALVEAAARDCTVTNSVRPGFPVTVRAAAPGELG
ncbi:OsmC family protein [Amaricoccus sp.]|uniref:OsmC family protein n=1 Tax=Amaricoccus sp. TaxID=1872485 RepID=UPI001B504F81|nr:OsmC family protein [Amaricoccus sp.]MBP7002387.1 OsmC family protein [Amaricoccus sp.]